MTATGNEESVEYFASNITKWISTIWNFEHRITEHFLSISKQTPKPSTSIERKDAVSAF